MGKIVRMRKRVGLKVREREIERQWRREQKWGQGWDQDLGRRR